MDEDLSDVRVVIVGGICFIASQRHPFNSLTNRKLLASRLSVIIAACLHLIKDASRPHLYICEIDCGDSRKHVQVDFSATVLRRST